MNRRQTGVFAWLGKGVDEQPIWAGFSNVQQEAAPVNEDLIGLALYLPHSVVHKSREFVGPGKCSAGGAYSAITFG